MSTQAASTRPMNRPMNDPQNPASMRDMPTQQMPAMRDGRRNDMQAPGTETKQAFKTTEFWIYLIAVAAVLGASQVVGKNSAGVDIFRADNAWFLITLLTLGYLGSRGLAKAGSNWRSSEERKARH
ncbi:MULTISPECIES: hypothetical protein [Micromonospora]|uniref:Uncharacterized protein n=1 Tax=Micromonospora zamorensis TaxID=709883 RepID=A0ABZ1P7E5_9ACTN|nr:MULTISPECIES: hypothetical protein [Micromonospora]MBQ0980200.1 hypothetical protein [Micromonospora sp. M61]MBQ1039479.1 hypothetical protein [Micromonospora sp. C81]WSK47339.1 hypothetical protein OG423_25565 [Micromonospora zamorensis]WTE89951.1 hypothetical protein OHA01_15150 [Micromonospora zamorensis]WTI18773.1 hypothetical protein OG886_17335 [Micromonospora zamorensis]